MVNEPDGDRLRALEARIAAARGAPRKDHMEEHYSQAQLAWRMVIEMVAGVGIGFLIGYGADFLLGTQPWMMVVFTMLGFAAGVKVMIASAREVQGKIDAVAALKEPGAGAPKDEGENGR
jgi:ATP synthase protein I